MPERIWCWWGDNTERTICDFGTNFFKCFRSISEGVAFSVGFFFFNQFIKTKAPKPATIHRHSADKPQHQINVASYHL